MLPSEIPFRTHTWPRRVLAFLLREACLGFFAIIAAALTLFPMLFPVSTGANASLEAFQWGIIALFAVEYVVALVAAPHEGAFLRNPWRLIDALTILLPLVSLLPSVSHALRSSPVLRLIRLVRLISLGARATGVVTRAHLRRGEESITEGPARITRIRGDAGAPPAEVTWDELLRWVKSAAKGWYHVSNPASLDLDQIAAQAGIPPSTLRAELLGTGFPHVEKIGNYAGLFVWLPHLTEDGRVERSGVFLLIAKDHLLSLSHRPAHLTEKVRSVHDDEAEGGPVFANRMVAQFFAVVLRGNERLVGAFQQRLHALEELPVRESRPEFFERTFRLKKELSAAQSDLWRLKTLLSELAEGRARLPGAPAEATTDFPRLANEAAYVFETILTTREELLSLIDLHLNIVSFDMNRVMRLLAVVSALGLIPAVVGGLFGMNLVDNPWPLTLPQVAFGVGLSMVLGLYFFFVKGWLR
jgi:Mg2+ and Co2+ transporter CorA